MTHVHELHCHLDMRIYRRLERGGILFEGGDLDNRLKTFFDALSVPVHPEQVPKEQDTPAMDENAKDWPPLFCLLDDDKAITRLAIQSFKMLTPVPAQCEHPENWVELDLDIDIRPATPMQGSVHILFP